MICKSSIHDFQILVRISSRKVDDRRLLVSDQSSMILIIKLVIFIALALKVVFPVTCLRNPDYFLDSIQH